MAGDKLMIERFHNEDAGYRRWRKAHSGGYVFNYFGGSDVGMNVLHRAECDHLVPQRLDMQWTSVPKVCSVNRGELEAEADDLRGGRDRWTSCDRCLMR
jgi:hypothetical protein